MLKKNLANRHSFLSGVLLFVLFAVLHSACAFGSSDVNDILTPDERLWLKNNHAHIILAIETTYAPFVFLDTNGQPAGLAQDYISLIQSKLGFQFEQRRFTTLDDILGKLRGGDVQIVNAVTKTPARLEYISFTKPFISVPNVIIVRKSQSGQVKEENLSGLKVSLVKSYAVTEYLANRGLNFSSDLVPDDLTALLHVSFGVSDATVIDLATASYLIEQKGITNLRVAGETAFNIQLAMGTAKAEPILYKILQKGLAAITKSEQLKINKRWIDAFGWRFFYDSRFWIFTGGVLFIALAFIATIIIWNLTLRRQVDVRTLALAGEKEALRASEEDLKESQRIAHVGSWRLDIATNQVVWSEELYKIYGFDPAIPPPPYTEHQKLFTLESWKRLSTALANTKQTGIQYELELETVRGNGTSGWIWVYGETVRDAQGKAVGLRGAVQDITERKFSETRLRESEERFKALHNASFGGIIIHDKGLILECNQGLSEITGYTLEELIGMDGFLLIAPSSRELMMNNIVAGYEKAYEAIGIRKNGEEYPVRIEGKTIPYKGKNVRTTEFRDISDFKQAEAEREKLQAQLTQAQKMESVGRLAGGVAHDFNNMLGVILGHAELIQEDLDPSQQLYTEVEEIRKAAVRSANLTRQLLAFARNQTIAPKVLDFNEAIAGMLSMVQRLIGEDIDLVWKPDANLWPVKMDPSQIDQILANLCVNARDAIPGVGKITIETDRTVFDEVYCASHIGFFPGEYVQLAISDNGCGMEKETLANLFEPFFTTKELGKGTGLGMATVYGIVKQNNGFINVYSEPGQGTTFKIYLLRHKANEALLEENIRAEPITPCYETILLVEDEPAILDMTTTMLERLGYTVLAASTPTEGLGLAKEHHSEINLILTDVIMPEMNGRDLVERLMPLNPDMKALFMSGYTANVIAHHGVLDKGVEFIEKPFSRRDLASKLRNVLGVAARNDKLSDSGSRE